MYEASDVQATYKRGTKNVQRTKSVQRTTYKNVQRTTYKKRTNCFVLNLYFLCMQVGTCKLHVRYMYATCTLQDGPDLQIAYDHEWPRPTNCLQIVL